MPGAKRKTADNEIAADHSPEAMDVDESGARRSTRAAAVAGKEKLAAMNTSTRGASKADRDSKSPVSPKKKAAAAPKRKAEEGAEDAKSPVSPKSPRAKKTKAEEDGTMSPTKKQQESGTKSPTKTAAPKATAETKPAAGTESPTKPGTAAAAARPASPTKNNNATKEGTQSPVKKQPGSPTKAAGAASGTATPTKTNDAKTAAAAAPKSPTKQTAPTKESVPAEAGKGTLERGQIFFFYRPKVETTHVETLDDVQKLYMILKPTTLSYSPNPSPVQTQEDGTEVYVGHRVREIIISKKKLPEIGTHARYWGFVDHVVDDVGELEGYLKGSTYETKTRGTRHLEAARPVGEGVYAIVEHGSHTHLAYVLSLPETPTEVQKAFNIQSEGSYILSIKNPTVSSAPGTGLHGPQKAQLPPAFQSLFKQLRFIPANPPALLDFQHTEILLIGASDDVGNELGREGQELEQMEEEAHKEIVKLEDEHLFDELRLDKMEFKTEPLFGEWA